MRTAALVLAILGDVFGGLGAVGAFFFGAALVGLSSGAAGRGAAGGALVALIALGIGITGTALVSRRPRVAGGLCLAAALLGSLGTFAFALGSLLYAIGGVLAFFVPPSALVASPATASQPLAAPLRAGVTLRRPRLTRRVVAISVSAALLVLALLGGSALAQPPEQKPVRALLEGLRQADDIALAAVLAPALRAGTATRDAEAALSYALGASEIGFLNADWLRRLGPATGTTMAFENLTLATSSKTSETAVVHVRGLFVPTNDNGLIRLLLQGLRQPFDADIALAQVGGSWYVTRSSVSAPTAPSTSQPVIERPTTALTSMAGG